MKVFVVESGHSLDHDEFQFFRLEAIYKNMDDAIEKAISICDKNNINSTEDSWGDEEAEFYDDEGLIISRFYSKEII